MKAIKSLTSFSALKFAVGFGSVAASAETVILTISVNDAAERYYKVQEFMKEIQDSQTHAQELVANINEEG